MWFFFFWQISEQIRGIFHRESSRRKHYKYLMSPPLPWRDCPLPAPSGTCKVSCPSLLPCPEHPQCLAWLTSGPLYFLSFCKTVKNNEHTKLCNAMRFEKEVPECSVSLLFRKKGKIYCAVRSASCDNL